MSSMRTSGKRHVSLAETTDVIQCPLSDNLRFAIIREWLEIDSQQPSAGIDPTKTELDYAGSPASRVFE